MNRARLAITVLVLVGFLSVPASRAEEPPRAAGAEPRTLVDPESIRMLGEMLQQNRDALERFRWTSRVEIRLDGELLIVQLFRVRFDGQGRLDPRLIGSPKRRPSRFISSRRSNLSAAHASSMVVAVTGAMKPPAEKSPGVGRR